MTRSSSRQPVSPFRQRADFDESSVFLPQNLLREARRQRGLADGQVPRVCVLDPDADIVRYLRNRNSVKQSPSWACYHTSLWEFEAEDISFGIVGEAVGAPFAVLVAEELFASGCELLISISSAGKIAPELPDTSMFLIDRALRGEGTSDAYLPMAPDICPDLRVLDTFASNLEYDVQPVLRGTSWTTDAPFRETQSALQVARSAGAMVVEMEAAALYSFAKAGGRAVICFAHLTNAMGVNGNDFEKGPTNGAAQAVAMISTIAKTLGNARQ